jgi:hypothetical protein
VGYGRFLNPEGVFLKNEGEGMESGGRRYWVKGSGRRGVPGPAYPPPILCHVVYHARRGMPQGEGGIIGGLGVSYYIGIPRPP